MRNPDQTDDGGEEPMETPALPSDPTDATEDASATLPEREDAHALTVIGLGGSAGSIPAMSAFFERVPEDSGSAYVVVIHLSAEHESHLAEILGRSTKLPVRQVTEPVRLAPNQVYVIPPGNHLEMHDGTLRLSDREAAQGRRIAIDSFFRTLATAHGPQAAGVVFSGTGADGALGIRQIKEYGGLVVVQIPNEAEHDTMPRNAIATGAADYVLPAAAMPAQIATYWETSRRMRIPAEAAPSPEQREEGPEQEQAIVDILTLVRAQTGHDFSQYKRATILRRIGRRMQVNRLETLPGYRDYLRTHHAEVDGLIGDLLISVTQFFRDPEAWEAMERDIVPRLFDEAVTQEPVRAWVCGCATGEEAYSLAILLQERAERTIRPPRIQIFASDMDVEALALARAGIYPETIAGDMAEERLRRWFYRQNGSYLVRKEVRDTVLFAHHDVLKDTPFSRLDLVTCRNLLIYLNREAQERVFRTFHFALRGDGRLMLGPSESAETSDGLFGLSDKANRLYIRRSVARSVISLPPAAATFTANRAGTAVRPPAREARPPETPPRGVAVSPAEASAPVSGPVMPGRTLFQSALERFGPPMVLVNETFDVVHLSGDVSRFLRFAGGEPSYNLLDLVRDDLRIELRAALYAAVAEGGEQIRFLPNPATEGALSTVRLVVRPLAGGVAQERDNHLLVQFDTLPLPSALPPAGVTAEATDGGSVSADAARRLAAENAALTRRLRATVDQSESVTEELKASNEEFQATNEEARTIAEELETGKEELQSVNEELFTVNYELKARVEELTGANSDLQNFLGATDIGTVFLDRALRIRRYTPAAESLFHFIPTDVGRPLAHLAHRLDYPALIEDADAVLSRLTPIEREVSTADGRQHFMARLQPYQSLDDRIEGVVVTFVDITERKRAGDALRASEERLGLAVEIGEMAGWDWNLRSGEVTWSDRHFLVQGYDVDEVTPSYEAWLARVHPEDREETVTLIEKAREERLTYAQEYRSLHPDGRVVWCSARGRFFYGADGQPYRMIGVMQDITERKQREEDQAFLLKLADALRTEPDVDAIADRALQMLIEHLQLDRSYIVSYRIEEDRADLVHQVGNDTVPPLPNVFILSDYPEAFKATFDHTLVIEDEFERQGLSEKESHSSGRLGMRAMVATTLRNENNPLWSMVVINSRPRRWTSAEIKLVEEVAERTWAAVERARAEAALRESEARFRHLSESGLIGIAFFDTGGNIADANDHFLALIGFTRSELQEGKARWDELTPPEWMSRTRQAVEGFRTTGIITPYEKEYFRKDGSRFWGLFGGARVNHTGEGIAFIVDITERKRAEEALRESESRLHSIANLVPDLLWDSEPDGSTNWYNQRWLDYTGQSFEEATGRGWVEAIHPDDREASARRYREAVENGEVLRQEHRIRRYDGEYRWFVVNAFPLKDESGKVVKIYGAATDIHDSRLMLEALRQSEEQFRRAIEEAPIPVLMHAEDGEVLQVSRSWTDLTGYTLEDKEVIQTWLTKAYGFGGEEVRDAMELSFIPHAGEPMRAVVFDITTRQGERRTWSFSASTPGTLRDGRRFVVGMAEDITERRRREANLAFLAEVSEDLVRLTNIDETMNSLGAKIAAYLGLSACAFAEIDEAEIDTINYDWHRSDMPSLVGIYRMRDFVSAEVLQLCRAGENVVIRDVFADPRTDGERYAAFNIGSFVSIPHVRNGDWRFLLVVYRTVPYDWRDDEIELIRELTNRIWTRLERARAEEAMRESEARFRFALDAAQMGTFLYHMAEDRGEPDARMLTLFGLPEEGTLNLAAALAEIIHPDDRARYAEAVARSADPTGDRMLNEEIRVVHPDQSIRWVVVTAQTIFEEEPPRAVRMYGVAADITERKHAEEALRQSEERLRMLFGTMSQGVAIMELVRDDAGAVVDCRFLDLNPAFDTLTGFDRNAVVGQRVSEVFPQHFLNFQPRLETVEGTAGSERFVARIPETGRWFSFYATPFGGPDGFVVFYDDITERKHAEDAQRESQARFRTLSDAVPQVIWTNTAEGAANYFNRRWYEYSGLSYEESGGPGWQAIVHPDDAPASVDRWHQALAAGEVFDTEYRLRRHDGAYRWFLVRNVPTKDANGQVTGWFGTATDIDDLKRAEAARQESEERFRLLVEGAKDYAMFLLSPENRITYWNVGAERLLGWSEQDAVGQDGAIIFTPEDREQGAPEREAETALATGRALDRRWHLRKDGSRFWADGILMRLDDKNGNLRGFAKVARDATEQKRAEEAIQASLEAIAQANETLEQRVQERTQDLADANVVRRELLHRLVNAQEEERGHIARELHDNTGQLVTALSLGLTVLPGVLPSPLPAPASEILAKMRQTVGELGMEAHRLSANLRPTALDQLGLVPALKNYTEQWKAWSGLMVDYQTIGFDGESEGEGGDRLPREVESTVYRIVQEALTNILRHASPNRPNATAGQTGRRGAAKSANRVSILLQRTERHLIATVEDDGPGFDVQVAMSLPLDRRRLGLFGMKERAELIGGALEIASRVGKGTTVFLRVPLEPPAPDAVSEPPSEPG